MLQGIGIYFQVSGDMWAETSSVVELLHFVLQITNYPTIHKEENTCDTALGPGNLSSLSAIPSILAPVLLRCINCLA